MSCSVSASDPVEELSLYIKEKTRGSNPEHFVVQPAVTQLLFDHNQPSSGVLCCPKYQLHNYIYINYHPGKGSFHSPWQNERDEEVSHCKKSPKKSPSRVTFQGSYFFCRGELNEPFYKRVEKK